MRTPTCLLPKMASWALAPALVASAIASIHVGQSVAQETVPPQAGSGSYSPVPANYQGSGSFFNRQLGTAFRFNYHTQAYGTQDGVLALGSMKVFNLDEATVFFDGQATLNEDFGGGFNLGVGYRELGDCGFGCDSQRIHGISFWTDGQSTNADNFFTQLGFSLESLGESFDARFNGHFPLERTKVGDPSLLTFRDPAFLGDHLISESSTQATDTAHTVIDGELAKRIGELEAWAFVGGYQLSGGGLYATGYRAGVRGYALPDLAVSLQVMEDDVYDTNVVFGITWFIGRTHSRNLPRGNLSDRFREPVLRNDFIATTQTSEVVFGVPLTDPTTGDDLRFVHIDTSAAAGGDGTIEKPLQSFANVAGLSQVNDNILVHSGSVLASGQYSAKNGQRILGEGGNILQTVDTAELGVTRLPETSPGAIAGSVPIINGTGDVLTLADDNEVNNFTISGGSRAVVASGVNGPTLRNLDINSTTSDGVVLTNITSTSLIENTVSISNTAGTALLVDGGGDTANLAPSIVNSAGRSLDIRNRSGGTLTFSGPIADTGLGVVIEDNSASTINLTNALTINTGTNDAVTTRNNTGSSVTFSNLAATTTTANSMLIEGGGSVTVNSNASTLTNTGTGSALIIRGDNFVGASGDSTVNIAATINNSGGGRSVTIQDRTANNVILSGPIDDTSEGVLVQDNSAGSILFSAALTLNTGTNDAVRLTSNSGTNISFVGGLDIDTTSGTGFFADGGGTLGGIGTNTIDTGSGVGLSVANMSIDASNFQFDSVNVTNGATGGILLDTLGGSGQAIVGSGISPGDGGTLVVAGTAIRINNVNQATLINVTVNNTAAGSDGVLLTSNAGDETFFSGLNITTEDIGFSSIGNGELSVTATNTISTQTGTALKIMDNQIDVAGVTFDSVFTTAATGAGIELDDLTGGTVTVGPNSGTAGDGGTLATAGTSVIVNNVEKAAFHDLTISSSGSDAITVTYTSATSNLMNLTLTNNNITAANDHAFSANLNAGIGDVQFLLTDNTMTNNSGTNATMDVSVANGVTLNATIGSQNTDSPLGDSNQFTNNNAGGTAFVMDSNAAGATINLDLRDNTATGGAVDFELTKTAGTFGIVDLTNTVTADSNNVGTVDLGGNIEADFDDLTPPIDQVTP
ncbi:MAG: hypothetical protein ABGX16_12675 [Pirellulales bacterium]